MMKTLWFDWLIIFTDSQQGDDEDPINQSNHRVFIITLLAVSKYN
jgi:hypothetical protein